MDKAKFLAILDKHIAQEALLVEMGKELLLPELKKALDGVDLIPGTDLDQVAIQAFLKFVEEKLAAA